MSRNYLSYRGYTGSVSFAEEDGVFHGRVAGIKSLITFEGDSVASLTADFHNAIDEYLEIAELMDLNAKNLSRVPSMYASAQSSIARRL